jgi:hypothetical protein
MPHFCDQTLKIKHTFLIIYSPYSIVQHILLYLNLFRYETTFANSTMFMTSNISLCRLYYYLLIILVNKLFTHLYDYILKH